MSAAKGGHDLESLKAFARKHKVALGVGAVVLALLAFGGEDEPTYAQSPQSGPIVVADGGGGGSGGGFDMDRWREDQRREDGIQRDRIDAIREVERCYDSSTGETVEVSIHVGC